MLRGWREFGAAVVTGGRAVVKGGAEFTGSRSGFIGKCGVVVGDFLGVAVLVILVVWNVGWLSTVIRGCRLRVLGTVVGELVPDGVDDGTDPVGRSACAFLLKKGAVGMRSGCRWSGRGLNAEDVSHG